jgi:hypothetical protein
MEERRPYQENGADGNGNNPLNLLEAGFNAKSLIDAVRGSTDHDIISNNIIGRKTVAYGKSGNSNIMLID